MSRNLTHRARRNRRPVMSQQVELLCPRSEVRLGTPVKKQFANKSAKAVAHWQKRTTTHRASTQDVLQSHYSTPTRTYVGWSTIKVDQNTKIGVWDSEGSFSIVTGPKRVSLYKSEYVLLPRLTATPEQFVSIEYLDGKKDVKSGPCDVWFNPSEHKHILTKNKTTIDQNECLVVYCQSTSKKVKRKIITGPMFYIPPPNSWMHDFIWNEISFKKLQTTPDNMDVDVEYVRTADDALLNVNLRVFFHINDVLQMIDASGDPISDLSNAIASDIIQAVAKVEFNKFKGMTESLNDIGTYKDTLEMAKDIGCSVDKVVFKGYQAGKALQQMVDEGIKKRALLLLEGDKDKQKQQLLDSKLDHEQARAKTENKLQTAEAEHKIKLAKLEIALEEEKHAETLKHINQAADEAAKRDIEFLSQLKSLGVDLTAYLVSKPDGLHTEVC